MTFDIKLELYYPQECERLIRIVALLIIDVEEINVQENQHIFIINMCNLRLFNKIMDRTLHKLFSE